jgi:hypothetical protein
LSCKQNGIPINFVDTAHNYVEQDGIEMAYLDYTDQKTKLSAIDLGYNVSIEQLEDALDNEDINPDDIDVIDQGGHNVVSPTGFHIRNDVMVANCLEAYKKQKPDVLVLGTGNIHVLGAKLIEGSFNSPYANSLTKIFRDKACVVAPCGINVGGVALPLDVDKTGYTSFEGLGYSDKIDDETAIQLAAEFSGGLVDYFAALTDEQRAEYREDIGRVVEQVTAPYTKPSL